MVGLARGAAAVTVIVTRAQGELDRAVRPLDRAEQRGVNTGHLDV
jgi:hypothetical protein